MIFIEALKKIAQPIMFLSYQFSGLFNRNPNRWIFGAWRGEQYSDNSKYLFEYTNKYCKDIECIWLTKNKKVEEKLKNQGVKVFCGHGLQSLYYVLTAGVAIETEGVQDIPFHWFMKGIKTIQLFHGFPLKSGSKWVEHGLFKRANKPWQNQYDKMYWMSYSEAYIDVMKNWGLFGKTIPENMFVITGAARNDVFVNKPECSFINKFREEHPNAKLICYMPTHRNFGSNKNKILDENTLKYVNDRLKEANIYMILKPHFHEIKNYIGKERFYDHIIFALTDEFYDVYEYLPMVDLLISDYSSIIIDFLCANKPIVIFDYDLNDYIINDAGIEDIYFKLEFGPKCQTWESVLYEVKNQLENDTWFGKRNRALKITNSFSDGHNCNRIYNAIKTISQK